MNESKAIEEPKEEKEEVRLPRGFSIVDPLKYFKLRKKKKRGPKKKVGRPRKEYKMPPSQRDGMRFHAISVPELTYIHLKELKRFYDLPSISKTIAKIVEPAFEKAFQDAISLKKIAERKEKERVQAENKIAAYFASRNKL